MIYLDQEIEWIDKEKRLAKCPKCGSKDTRFVEPHYEMSVYECNVCGCRFEVEEV